MGRHSAGMRDADGPGPDGAPPSWGPVRSWTARHKVLTVLGSGIAATMIITGVASAVLGGGKSGNRPGGNVAAVSGASTSVRPHSSAPDPSAPASAPATTTPPPKASPSAGAPAHSSPASTSSLAQLPVNTALTGKAAVAWGDAALTALGAPTTPANVQTMVDWFANEGTPHNLNNPLNLQTPFGGSTISTADGDPSIDRIQAYPTPADFVGAFPLEMNSGSYPAIVAALKAGRGLEGSAATGEIASELAIYSGDGYNSIPAH